MQAFNKKIVIIASIAIVIFLASSFFLKDSPDNLSRNLKKDEILRNEEHQEITREFQGNEDKFIELINKSRNEQGLPLITRNDKLSQSAMKKARDMEKNQYFEHVSPGKLQPWFFAEEEGYDYKNFGENLAEGFFSAESTHESWMKSSGHRDNILSEEFEEIGVAIFSFEQNGLQSFLIVQHFGTQFETKDSLKITCALKIKDHCRDAERKRSEIKDSIEEQESFIKQIKRDDSKKEDLNKTQENIIKLEKIKDDLKIYIKDCENYIDKCEEWK